MNILNEIISQKRKEVKEKKRLYSIPLLEKSIYFDTPPVSLKKYLQRKDKSGVIAEIKRRSPSEGWINKYISVEKVSIGYMQAGASALSILTDHMFFGGSNEDLTEARHFNFCPILRKDFIIDDYQIIEAKSIGADAILLIAAILSEKELDSMYNFAKSLNLEVLFEVHNQTDLEKVLNVDPILVGVNSRNLKTFKTDFDLFEKLANQIPDHITKVAESGIHSAEQIIALKTSGYEGFLVGSRFMKDSEPHSACRQFLRRLAFLDNYKSNAAYEHE